MLRMRSFRNKTIRGTRVDLILGRNCNTPVRQGPRPKSGRRLTFRGATRGSIDNLGPGMVGVRGVPFDVSATDKLGPRTGPQAYRETSTYFWNHTDPDSSLITITASPVDPDLPFGSFRDNDDGTGTYSYIPGAADIGRITLLTFIASDGLGSDTIFTNLQVVSFLRVDVDGYMKYTMNDLVVLITYLFRSGPAPSSIAAADTDGDGTVNILDITYLINFLYYGGPQPPQ